MTEARRDDGQRLRIGVILSMKAGIEAFVHRELSVFAELGHEILLLPTKWRPGGLYEPAPGWTLFRWRPARVVLAQATALLRHPRLYLRLLREALASGALADLALAWTFARKAAGVDVLYATFGDHKLFVGYYLKRITGKPLVVTIHAYELYLNPNPGLFPRALRAADRIMTVTEYNRELLLTRFAVPAEQLALVRINVDVDEFRPGDAPVRILTVGSFVEKKGHEILLRALAQLGRDDLELWIVGGPSVYSDNVDVPALAERLGVAARVAFFGSQRGAALKALYRDCDLFCLPSRTDRDGNCEGFPTVIAEAMAFGKPVVSTHHVEIPRVLPEVIVPENDVDALAGALAHLADSSALRARLGRANRDIATALFSTENARASAAVLASAARQQPLESR